MNPSTAYGLIVLSSLFTALTVWVVSWRWWCVRRLPDHAGYIMGFEACSRIRDREESQERKAVLLKRSCPEPLHGEPLPVTSDFGL